MEDKEQEIIHLRESLKICAERMAELRELLRCSLGILRSKHVIVLRKDDEFRSIVEDYIRRCSENGLVDS